MTLKRNAASGKLFLSQLPGEQMSSLIENLNLEQKTENTLTTAKSLMSALVKIRKEQVGTDNEEFVDGMVSVAVPILDRRIAILPLVQFTRQILESP